MKISPTSTESENAQNVITLRLRMMVVLSFRNILRGDEMNSKMLGGCLH